eukprot:1780804-Amphidinium_carterae.1
MTINAGGWAPVVDSLALGIYDIVLVQETWQSWLLEGSIRSAAFKVEQLGYEGAFTPARKVGKDKALGRGKGGLAVLSRIGTPMLRATMSPQADLGRWMHVLLQVRPEEPEEFPLHLSQGTGLHRPLARPGASAPRGHRRLDWFLASAGLLPSLGWEEVTGFKPDHSAPLILLKLLRGFSSTPWLGNGPGSYK